MNDNMRMEEDSGRKAIQAVLFGLTGLIFIFLVLLAGVWFINRASEIRARKLRKAKEKENAKKSAEEASDAGNMERNENVEEHRSGQQGGYIAEEHIEYCEEEHEIEKNERNKRGAHSIGSKQKI